MGITYAEIVKEYFPDASDDVVDFILWEKTGYPVFWRGDIETCLRQQLQELRDSLPAEVEGE